MISIDGMIVVIGKVGRNFVFQVLNEAFEFAQPLK